MFDSIDPDFVVGLMLQGYSVRFSNDSIEQDEIPFSFSAKMRRACENANLVNHRNFKGRYLFYYIKNGAVKTKPKEAHPESPVYLEDIIRMQGMEPSITYNAEELIEFI